MKRTKSARANELHDYYAYWLHRLSGAVLQTFERELAKYDVTHAQWYVLITVYREDADTPQAIAKFIEIDIGSVSRVIDRLVVKGFLVKRPHEEDRRSVFLELTPEGEETISALAKVADVLEKEWRACLTEEETQALATVLHKLLVAQGLTPAGKIWNAAPTTKKAKR